MNINISEENRNNIWEAAQDEAEEINETAEECGFLNGVSFVFKCLELLDKIQNQGKTLQEINEEEGYLEILVNLHTND